MRGNRRRFKRVSNYKNSANVQLSYHMLFGFQLKVGAKFLKTLDPAMHGFQQSIQVKDKHFFVRCVHCGCIMRKQRGLVARHRLKCKKHHLHEPRPLETPPRRHGNFKKMIGEANVREFRNRVDKMRSPLESGYAEEFYLLLEEGAAMYKGVLRDPDVNLALMLEKFLHGVRPKIQLGQEADEEPDSGRRRLRVYS